MDIIEQDIADAINASLRRNLDELRALTREELMEKRWFYKHDYNFPPAIQLYDFTQCLEMYRQSCRQWEEFHNGSSCVVERVRDQYLMPKIREFNKVFKSDGSV